QLVVLVSPLDLFGPPDSLLKLLRPSLLHLTGDGRTRLVRTFSDVLRLADVESDCLTLTELHRNSVRQGGDGTAVLHLPQPRVQDFVGESQIPGFKSCHFGSLDQSSGLNNCRVTSCNGSAPPG